MSLSSAPQDSYAAEASDDTTRPRTVSATARSPLQRFVARLPLHLVIIAIAILWLVPTVGLLVSSFRTPQAIRSTGWWTVFEDLFAGEQWTLQNYDVVLNTQGLLQAFRNSLYVTVPGTLLPVLVAASAAFALAWMDFRGRQTLFVVIIALIVVPLQVTFIPVLRMFNRLGITGSFIAIWLAHTGYGLPFAIYLLRNFFGSLPRDLFESAYLDGASQWQAFTRLALPLSVPSLAALIIFQFLWVWNDLLVALIYLGGTPRVAPLTVIVANLVNSLGAEWHLLPSAAFIAMVLPLIVFLSLQRYFVRGILAGSVKG
ncbi:MAG TPA: carbohydrate ABC transporter permease [Chloroflexi bacterium]|jgi:alpha-glucoside transport system permease protein|nr:carbohydrate ABC transporter permease [Chloroflexota bacterium]